MESGIEPGSIWFQGPVLSGSACVSRGKSIPTLGSRPLPTKHGSCLAGDSQWGLGEYGPSFFKSSVWCSTHPSSPNFGAGCD